MSPGSKMKWFSPVLLLALVTGSFLPVGCALASGAAAALYNQANQAYRDGDYERAIELYGRLLEESVVNPLLYYNLGNSFYRSGKLGKAIVNYERALRLAPNDEDVRVNLAFVRGEIQDKITAPRASILERVVDSLIRRAPQKTVIWLLVFFYWAGCLAAMGLILSAGRNYRRYFRWTFIVLCILLLLSGGVGYGKLKLLGAEEGIIQADAVSGRSGPGEDYTLVFTVHEGTKVRVREASDGWVLVALANRLEGWIPRASFERI